MRHLDLRQRIGGLAIGALALASGIDASGIDKCAAAPLDFLFGGPPLASRPAYRLRRRSAAPLTKAEIPLPVPRPHFPGDQPAGMTQAESAPPTPPAVAAKPPDLAKPTDKPPTEAAGVPVPPPKPADLGTPAKPVTPVPHEPKSEAKTEPPKPESTAAIPTPPAKTTGTVAIPTPSVIPVLPPTPPPKPPDVAKPAKPDTAKPDTAKPNTAKPTPPPAVAPSGATTAFVPRSPDDDPQCPSRLQARHVDVAPTAIGPQRDDRCTVVEPVRLAELTLPDGGKVAFPEHPTIACTTADAFSLYVRDLLAPLAKGTFGTPVAAIWTGPGLECRSRDSIFGAKLSAHGQGLAIDIAQLKLADGRLIEVGDPKTDAETGFETAARAGACGYFHTVLGPGSDSYHRTHWHFDLEVRGSHGDSKYCK